MQNVLANYVNLEVMCVMKERTFVIEIRVFRMMT